MIGNKVRRFPCLSKCSYHFFWDHTDEMSMILFFSITTNGDWKKACERGETDY